MVSDDLRWLAGRSTLDLRAPGISATELTRRIHDAGQQGFSTAVCQPTHLSSLPEQWTKATVVGYPGGRHHTLIKAAEARLAVQHGATEVWLALDRDVEDENTALSEVIAVRQAVPPPVTLVVITENSAHRFAAGQAADLIAAAELPAGIALTGSVDQAIAAIEQGAPRVATPHPWML